MNKNDDPFIDRLDPTLVNEQISHDQYFDEPEEFEAQHSQNIIEKLIHLSRFGNLLTLVVGNNGSGKSHLLESLVSAVDDTCQICRINAQPLLSIDQLFQQVIEAFADETTFTGIPLTANQYEEWAEQLTAIPGNRLLVIDDAEVLSTSVLHELCQLSAMQQEKDTPHLHLILFGNYDLNNILEQASQGILDEEGIYAIDIPSLNSEQSRDWLEYLFKKDRLAFLPDDEEFEKMLINGQGNFALLEDLAREYSATTHEFDEFENNPEPRRISGMGYWFGALTILILSVLGLFFYQKELTDLLGLNNTESLPLVIQQPIIGTTTDKTVEPLDEPTLDVISEPAGYEPLDAVIEGVVKTSLDEELASAQMVESNSDETMQPEIEQREVVNQEIVHQESRPEQSISEQEISDIEKIEEATTNINDHLTEAEQLILSFADEDYAIQVIGLRKESDIKSFVAQNSQPQMIYYKSSLAGKPWYIVILASYSSKSEASKARADLPEELNKYGPWIKSLKSIKSELTKAQQ